MTSVSDLPSTVAPSESASASGKKPKPGKRERAARRSQVSAPAGAPASADKAAIFASGGSGPTPQPGRYPVVFQTGAGEPSRDQSFTVGLDTLSDVGDSFPKNYVRNPKFAEFRAHVGTTNDEFRKMLSVSFLLRLAQQIVHSHANMGLPQGDFSPVANTDIRVLGAMSAVVKQYGEFSVPALGTRFLYADYDALVAKLVFAASQVDRGRSYSDVVSRMWLPAHGTDGDFRLRVAEALNEFLAQKRVSIPVTVLKDAVLSGTVPDAWEGIKGFLGEPPSLDGDGEARVRDERDRFDFVFMGQRDAAHFVTSWTSIENYSVLEELGLDWEDPLSDHVNWSISTKQLFTSLATKWSALNAAYAQFFEMTSGVADRSAASGSLAQMVDVSKTDEVTVVKSHLALSAPQFSLSACFPPECIFEGGLSRRVVVSTPVSVAQRATEFCQLDWR